MKFQTHSTNSNPFSYNFLKNLDQQSKIKLNKNFEVEWMSRVVKCQSQIVT